MPLQRSADDVSGILLKINIIYESGRMGTDWIKRSMLCETKNV